MIKIKTKLVSIAQHLDNIVKQCCHLRDLVLLIIVLMQYYSIILSQNKI